MKRFLVLLSCLLVTIIALTIPVFADSTTTLPTTFSTAVAFSNHGTVTVLQGITGQIKGTPTYNFGPTSLTFNGGIYAGVVSTTSTTSYGGSLFLSLNFGSLSVGPGVYYTPKNVEVSAFQPFLEVSYTLKL